MYSLIPVMYAERQDVSGSNKPVGATSNQQAGHFRTGRNHVAQRVLSRDRVQIQARDCSCLYLLVVVATARPHFSSPYLSACSLLIYYIPGA